VERIAIVGHVITGTGQGAHFTQLAWVRQAFVEELGIDPFPGTLNLKVKDPDALRRWKDLKANPGVAILPPPDSEFCRARCYRVLVAGQAQAAIVYPEVPGYPEDQLELIAPFSLRERLRLVDDDRVELDVLAD